MKLSPKQLKQYVLEEANKCIKILELKEEKQLLEKTLSLLSEDWGLKNPNAKIGITNEWSKQQEWYGNPSLGYDSYAKYFINPFNHKKVPVYVWGEIGDIHFTVSAGANSDFSYTGGFKTQPTSFEEAMAIVDAKYKEGNLII